MAGVKSPPGPKKLQIATNPGGTIQVGFKSHFVVIRTIGPTILRRHGTAPRDGWRRWAVREEDGEGIMILLVGNTKVLAFCLKLC